MDKAELVTNSPRLLDRLELLALVPRSDDWFRRNERRGKFPRRIRIGRRNYWVEAKVLDYVEHEAASARASANSSEGVA
jgi:predicted DNA-binding transcriptional regulator AlpA